MPDDAFVKHINEILKRSLEQKIDTAMHIAPPERRSETFDDFDDFDAFDDELPSDDGFSIPDESEAQPESWSDGHWMQGTLFDLQGDPETSYTDQPIVFPASRMASYTPRRIAEMRKLTARSAYSSANGSIFRRQAEFMADYTDDFVWHGVFSSYYPTYQQMTNQQLRGYFSWRTAVRRGETPPVCFSFVCVYVYELLNQIGVPDPRTGYDMLCDILDRYKEQHRDLIAYAYSWKRDYVVYYGLEKELLNDNLPEIFRDIIVLMEHETADASTLFKALVALSSYRLDNSRLYKLHPDETTELVHRLYLELEAHFSKNRKNNLIEHYFGRIYTNPYMMFQRAVFYDPEPHPDCDYVIHPLLSYHYHKEMWTVRRFYPHHEKSREMGAVLKELDYQLRPVLGIKSTLKPGDPPKYVKAMIERIIAGWQAERRAAAAQAEAEARRVAIDLSQLAGIRTAAQETAAKLIVDEDELRYVSEPAVSIPEPAPTPVSEPEPTPETGLNAAEYRLLQCLLYARSTDWVRAEGHLLSVLCDGINDKLFDRFDDTVLLGDPPELIEDYKDDLKGLILP